MDREPEVWKPVPGFEKWYRVSSHGRVKSVADLNNSRRKSRIMKIHAGYRDYPRVTFTKDGKAWYRHVHCLVAEMFIGPRPEGHHVHHIDGDKANNYYKNLVYLSAQQHLRCENRTLCPEEVTIIRLMCKLGYSQRYVCRVLGLHNNAAHSIITQGRYADVANVQ